MRGRSVVVPLRVTLARLKGRWAFFTGGRREKQRVMAAKRRKISVGAGTVRGAYRRTETVGNRMGIFALA